MPCAAFYRVLLKAIWPEEVDFTADLEQHISLLNVKLGLKQNIVSFTCITYKLPVA